jgi:hypothetical protein
MEIARLAVSGMEGRRDARTQEGKVNFFVN